MSYVLDIKPLVYKQIAEFKKCGQKQLLSKITVLFDELLEHPEIGTGKPKQLSGNLSGYWSRRISQEHRLIYSIDNHRVIIEVISVKGHYFDR